MNKQSLFIAAIVLAFAGGAPAATITVTNNSDGLAPGPAEVDFDSSAPEGPPRSWGPLVALGVGFVALTLASLVAVARRRAAAKYGEPTGAVLVGDTPLDVQAAHEAQTRAVAVMTGFADREAMLQSRPEALLDDLGDTAAAVAAITST